jgi:hypothetical protein
MVVNPEGEVLVAPSEIMTWFESALNKNAVNWSGGPSLHVAREMKLTLPNLRIKRKVARF